MSTIPGGATQHLHTNLSQLFFKVILLQKTEKITYIYIVLISLQHTASHFLIWAAPTKKDKRMAKTIRVLDSPTHAHIKKYQQFFTAISITSDRMTTRVKYPLKQIFHSQNISTMASRFLPVTSRPNLSSRPLETGLHRQLQKIFELWRIIINCIIMQADWILIFDLRI